MPRSLRSSLPARFWSKPLASPPSRFRPAQKPLPAAWRRPTSSQRPRRVRATGRNNPRSLTHGRPLTELVVSAGGDGPPASEPFVAGLLKRLGAASVHPSGNALTRQADLVDPQARLKRQMDEMAIFNERLIDDGPQIRDEFMSKINTKGTLDEYIESVKPYREYFAQKVIGQFDRRADHAQRPFAAEIRHARLPRL